MCTWVRSGDTPSVPLAYMFRWVARNLRYLGIPKRSAILVGWVRYL